jgi:hypothetical protein
MQRLSVLGSQLLPRDDSIYEQHPAPAAAAAPAAKVPMCNGVPRCVNADRETMEGRGRGAHGGPMDPPLIFGTIFQGTTDNAPFAVGSPMAFVHACVIPPGGGIGLHTHNNCEEIFVTIDNASEFTHNDKTVRVNSGAAVPVRFGEKWGAAPTRCHRGVAALPAPPSLAAARPH